LLLQNTFRKSGKYLMSDWPLVLIVMGVAAAVRQMLSGFYPTGLIVIL
jgi:hypothetical protein